ncbi:MAG: Mut7-C RNAse domain-containing protein [candidate division WOR-3 bacterium]
MKFICDSMLGKLARLLRMCGFDAEYFKSGLTLEILKNLRERDVIILTRNHKLTKVGEPLTIFNPDHDNPQIQLKLVIEKFSLKDNINFLSRCMECNIEIIPIEKSEAKGNVPFYVYDNHDNFFKCPSCGRIYWEGTHVAKMKEKLERIMKWL